MGSCVICGKSVDGAVCRSHEEDVAFEFEGSRPDQLGAGRYYRGEVDGFADFGVFVNIGDHVTGLLHESELEGRLDSLDWDDGESVYVQVKQVHDNGNVDLAWSIRQAPREFRGQLVHDPSVEGGTALAEEQDDGGDGAERRTPRQGNGGGGEEGGETAADTDGDTETGTETTGDPDTDDEESGRADGEGAAGDADRAADADSGTDESEQSRRGAEAERTADADPERVTVASLDDREGERVRLEGRVEDVRQTGGPTIFVVADETGSVDCAAFDGAGVRAYPEIEGEAVVAVVGEVERRHGDLQVESESIEVLAGEEGATVTGRLDDALADRASPPESELLAADPAVEAVSGAVGEVATAVRRAVIESRPVVIRHTATVDGYVAGAAIERAVLPLVREQHGADDSEYHFVDRRPLEDPFYDISAATGDVTDMLEDAARHDEKHPLFVLVDAGSTRESIEGFELLDAYDAPRVVVDGDAADEDVSEHAGTVLATPDATSAVLGANVAVQVNPEVRADVRHLPAVSYWEAVPEAYADLAVAADYESETVAHLREAVALEAYYQSYEDKREIIQDLLWGADNEGLAAHIAGQFREKLDDELATVDSHVERREPGRATLSVLDAAAFTHRFDFPPTTLLLDALHRRERDRGDGSHVTVVVDEAELRVRSTEPVDVREVGARIAERVPDAGVRARGSHDGRVEFLTGGREAVITAAVEVLGETIEVGQTARE
jgi:RecJ-like exonuclease